MDDFLAALDEVKPAFGAVMGTLEAYRLQGMLDYGNRFAHLMSSCTTLVQQVQVRRSCGSLFFWGGGGG
jgi:vesicle-fusing ATPase